MNQRSLLLMAVKKLCAFLVLSTLVVTTVNLLVWRQSSPTIITTPTVEELIPLRRTTTPTSLVESRHHFPNVDVVDRVPTNVFLPWKEIATTNNNTTTTTTASTASLCIFQESLQQRDRNSPSNEGLLLVRIPKSGSSTVGGIAARIAHSMAKAHLKQKQDSTSTATTATGTTNYSSLHVSSTTTPRRDDTAVCKSRLTHAWSTVALKRHGTFRSYRNPHKSFLWTILRDPAHRAVSSLYFFHIGKNGGHVRDAVQVLRRHSNVALRWVGAPNATTAGIYSVLQDFNLMGILERLDESLVLLQLLLDLQPQDVLYMTTKASGSYDISNKCQQTPKVVVTPAIQSYLTSNEWFENNEGDYLLYNAVNRSIDRTIEYLGRSKFDKALQTFLALKSFANERCQYKSPCIGPGLFRPKDEANSRCYMEDWGCGYECLDELFQDQVGTP